MKKNKLVAIIGADGSGKSTLVGELENMLGGQKGRIAVVPRTIKENVGEHYELPMRSVLLSLAKLFGRGLKWFVQYHLRFAPLMRRGQVIVCDRFYLDELLIDPLKYRYNAPAGITRFVRNLLPHPGLYILLDAPEDVLFSRKQEISLDELRDLRFRYLNWIRQQPNNHILDATLPMEDVKRKAQEIIRDWLEKDRSNKD